MRITVLIPPKGRLVLLGWGALPLAVLAPFFFWQSQVAGAIFVLAALAALFGLYVRALSFVAAADGGCLRILAGVVFPTEQLLPHASLCGTARITTPLLALAGCCLLLLHTPGGTVVLPGIARADARAISHWAAEKEAEA